MLSINEVAESVAIVIDGAGVLVIIGVLVAVVRLAVPVERSPMISGNRDRILGAGLFWRWVGRLRKQRDFHSLLMSPS